MKNALKSLMIRLFSLFPYSLSRCLETVLHRIIQFNVLAYYSVLIFVIIHFDLCETEWQC